MLRSVLTWTHKLPSKVNLCNFENEVTFGSSELLLLKFSNENYRNTLAHISFRPQICFENSFNINIGFFWFL